MKSKNLHYIVFSLFLVIIIGILIVSKDVEKDYAEPMKQNTNVETYSGTVAQNESTNETAEKNEYVVYYFHNNIRCSTCYKIENYTKEVFEQDFKDDYLFKVVNTDDNENEHFINNYSLYTKSVVLVKNQNGKEVKFINLPKVWSYIRNKEAFKDYLKTEMINFLK